MIVAVQRDGKVAALLHGLAILDLFSTRLGAPDPVTA